MTTMMLLAVATASAQTYSVSFPVVAPHPAHLDDDTVQSSILRYHVADGYSDRVIPSSWGPIECRIESGVVVVEFSATDDTWPTTWPSQVTCQSQSVTLVIQLTPAVVTGDYDPQVIPGAGITIVSAPNVGHYRSYRLPAGGSYVAGTWDARLSPAKKWPGVNCAMAFGPTGVPFLQVRATNGAPADQGYCVIGSGTGIPHLVNLTITR